MRSFNLSLLSLLVLAVFTSSALAASAKQCRALVLSAGGDLGSFEAGAVKAIVNNVNASDVEYDVLTGISIGSINSLGLSQFPKGQEKQAAQWLVNLWTPLKRADIYKNFKGGLVQGLLYERGLFDSSPSLNLLKKEITKAPQRKLNIGTCNLRTGNLVRYHENLTVPNLIEAALASGSVPTFFPYSTFDDEIYVDGGTTGVLVDISGAIDRCREIVDDDSNITLDIVFVQFAQLDFWSTNKKQKPYDVAQRSNNIQTYVKHYREYIEARDLNPSINFRYIIKPSKALYLPSLPFLFSNKQMTDMLQRGYDDAAAIIKSNPNGNGDVFYAESVSALHSELSVTSQSLKKEQAGHMNNRIRHYNKLKASLLI